ncbi:helix-turn-helix transcriptional regulator [Streptomyces mirabilis]|uniref:helix-turn-helix transcriptional regulator n=1 Tax=Streptomyces mirabilis TaxID=68239 RepID=UPI0021C16ECB|nr:helix-turn-helix transcriptional regulator [Streptomyces mirabilis]MCT9111663.1 helix-turn-helix transcriptional regulator [Streptomyces mirabilis]
MSGLRMTLQTQLVMRELLQHPTRAQYGLEVGQAVGLPSGTIHPILARLERAGIVESFWEAADEHAEASPPRPRRRYYRFTADGAETARQALAAAYKGGQTSARLTGKPVTDS